MVDVPRHGAWRAARCHRNWHSHGKRKVTGKTWEKKAHREDQAAPRLELLQQGARNLSCSCAHMNGIVGPPLRAAPVAVRLRSIQAWFRTFQGFLQLTSRSGGCAQLLLVSGETDRLPWPHCGQGKLHEAQSSVMRGAGPLLDCWRQG